MAPRIRKLLRLLAKLSDGDPRRKLVDLYIVYHDQAVQREYGYRTMPEYAIDIKNDHPDCDGDSPFYLSEFHYQLVTFWERLFAYCIQPVSKDEANEILAEIDIYLRFLNQLQDSCDRNGPEAGQDVLYVTTLLFAQVCAILGVQPLHLNVPETAPKQKMPLPKLLTFTRKRDFERWNKKTRKAGITRAHGMYDEHSVTIVDPIIKQPILISSKIKLLELPEPEYASCWWEEHQQDELGEC